MNCKKCNAEIQGTSKFCKQCGTPVSAESPASSPTKICPQCGAENPVAAKFCKRDGYAFEAKPQAAQASQSAPISSPPPVASPPPKAAQTPVISVSPPQEITPSSKAPVVIGIVIVLLLAAGAGGYYYWTKKNSGEPAKAVTEAETTSKTQTQAPVALPVVKPQEPPAIAAPSPAASTHDPAQVERGLNQELRTAGLVVVMASVDDRLHADLRGTVASREEKEKAVGIARGYEGVTGVDAASVKIVTPKVRSEAPVATPAPTRQPQAVAAPPSAPQKRDPAKMEGEIGRNLRANGINGITAQVSDDFAVTLKGSVRNAAEKDLAFNIARQFGAVGPIKDKVFIVE
jgi:ribosomal protein L40E